MTYLPNALKRETISVLLSWKRCLWLALTVDCSPTLSPENRIFRAVPIPCIWCEKINKFTVNSLNLFQIAFSVITFCFFHNLWGFFRKKSTFPGTGNFHLPVISPTAYTCHIQHNPWCGKCFWSAPGIQSADINRNNHSKSMYVQKIQLDVVG